MVTGQTVEDTTKAAFGDEAARWLAVADRDRSSDGHLFYSVRTTGVYCRPSRPSRRARREHMRFHLTTSDAERAGFRPCKRCCPGEPGLGEQRAASSSTRSTRRASTRWQPLPA